MNELEKLYEKKLAIEKKCEHWKTAQDGSYGMALHDNGYEKVINEINRIEEGQKNGK